MNKPIFAVLSLALLSTSAYAVEARPTGTLKIQADYQSDEAQSDSQQWSLASPGNNIGVLVVEQMPGSQFYGWLSYGFDPRSDELAFEQEHAYLAWQLPAFSLWAGHLPSIQQSYLINSVSSTEATVAGALATQDSTLYSPSERDAIRAEWRAGEGFVFAAQWLLNEHNAALPWSLVSSLNTAEGTLTASYHRQADGEAYWGAQVTYLAGQLELAAVGLYQEGWQAWDLQVGLLAQSTRSFVTYSVLEQQAGRWQFAVHQTVTPALTSYTEFAKRPQRGNVWTQGFKLRF